MSYILRLFVLAHPESVPISQEFYEQIKEANSGLAAMLAVEEKFDAFMENFVELESTVLSLGARHLAFESRSNTQFFEHKNLISRRIANFLSSGRLYRDGLPQRVNQIFGRVHPEATAFNARLEDITNQPMAYRMVEVLRNYAQHNNLPVSGLTINHAKDVVEGVTTGFASWLEPLVNAAMLSRTRNLKDDVAAELASAGESLKVMPLLREYVEYVGGLHRSFRELIEDSERTWDATHQAARERYLAAYPGRGLLSLGASKIDSHGAATSDRQYVPPDREGYRSFIRYKNLSTVNFSMRYVKWS